jgi:rhamnopyranosyl-N-acetylglucosaminyl-diphospho-decaprenol beta-1,3/1,4-galactofuranosyltransferase
LTFNGRETLKNCLDAIESQQGPLESILVVDNASACPVNDLVSASPHAQLMSLQENLGPAGGYEAGLRAFLETGAEWAWIIDDDCVAAPDALSAQLALAGNEPQIVLSTMIDAQTGRRANTQGWCGVLIPRAVIEDVGLPNAELFWWTEDTEYLQWRIPRAGYSVQRCAAAHITVYRARSTRAKPAWKYYYEARNLVYFRIHTQGLKRQQPDSPPLKLPRIGKASRVVARLAGRALFVESSERILKISMIAWGVVDGVRGRLGRTVRVDQPNRPETSTARQA